MSRQLSGSILGASALIGTATHDLIVQLALAGELPETPGEALALAGRHTFLHGRPLTQRISLRARLAAALLGYCRFAPPEGWECVAGELELPAGRLDLLWRGPDGAHVADELKTGALPVPIDDDLVQEQTQRLLQSALAEIGPSLRGIRLIRTLMPERSTFLRADGTTTHLTTDHLSQGDL